MLLRTTAYSPIPDTKNKLHSETQYFKYTMVGMTVVLLFIGVTALLRTTQICAEENGDILQLRNLLDRRPIDYSEIQFPTSAPVAPYSNLLSEATVANNQRQQCVNREPANTHWTPAIPAHPASENFNNDGLPMENKSCQDNGEVITESVVSNSIACLLPTASSKQCQNSVLKSKTPSSVSIDTFNFSLDQNSETNENRKFCLPSCPKQPEFEVSLSKCIIEAKVECTPESSLTCDQPTGSMCSLKLHNFPDVKQEIPNCQGYSEMGARRKDDSQSAREQLSSDSSGTYGARMGAMFTKRVSEDSCDRVSSSSSSSDSVYVPPVKCFFLRPKHGKLQQGKCSTENKQPPIDSNTNDSNSIAPIGLPCPKVISTKTSSNKCLSKTCEKNPESVEIKDHKDHVNGAFSQRGGNQLAPICGRLRCVVPNQILCGTNDPLSNDGGHFTEKNLAQLKSYPDEDSDSPGHSYEEVPENDYEYVE